VGEGLVDNLYDFYLNAGGYEAFFTTKYDDEDEQQYYISPAAYLESKHKCQTNNNTENYETSYKYRVATSGTLTVTNADSTTSKIKLYAPYRSLKQVDYQESFSYDVYISKTNDSSLS
jgi:hypothetical protein